MNLQEVLNALEKGQVVTATVNGQPVPLTKYTEFSVEKRYITIGDMLVPKPLTEPLSRRVVYYIPAMHGEELCNELVWDNDDYDRRVLRAGLVHLDEQSAITHAKALIKMSGGSYD